jgi:hypothetical protein
MSEKKRKFEQLEQGAQQAVTDIRQAIFYRWPTPAIPPEGKLDWDDDLAVVLIDYGYSILDDAVRWHRQNTEKRPSIPAIRLQCTIISEKEDRRKLSDSEREMIEYRRRIRTHPEEFVKVSDVIREVVAKRKAQGKPTWGM